MHGRAGGVAPRLFPVPQRRHFDRKKFRELGLAQAGRGADGAYVDFGLAAGAGAPADNSRQASQPADALLAQFARGFQQLDEDVVAHRRGKVRQ